jgi:stalled ribosome rescue protein Dom34
MAWDMSNSISESTGTTAAHVAVWIDHKQARIFHIRSEDSDETTVAAPLHHIHTKHREGQGNQKAHPEDALHFFTEVAHALHGAREILVVGPSTAKLELLRHLHKHDAALERCVVGVETVDHPTDRQLVADARDYFIRLDRMR